MRFHQIKMNYLSSFSSFSNVKSSFCFSRLLSYYLSLSFCERYGCKIDSVLAFHKLLPYSSYFRFSCNCLRINHKKAQGKDGQNKHKTTTDKDILNIQCYLCTKTWSFQLWQLVKLSQTRLSSNINKPVLHNSAISWRQTTCLQCETKLPCI